MICPYCDEDVYGFLVDHHPECAQRYREEAEYELSVFTGAKTAGLINDYDLYTEEMSRRRALT